MVCVHCGHETKVSNSRSQKRANQVWRRRQCQSCGAVFTTEEAPDYGSIWLVRSHTGKVRPFSRDQLFLSLYRACEHRRSALEDAAGLAETIIIKLAAQTQATDGSLTAAQVVQTALVALNRFDRTAATVYQAYHPL